MKPLFATATLAALTCVAPFASHAQDTKQIVKGRATIALAPALLQQFAALGLTIANLPPTQTQEGINVLPAVEGAIDLDTASNEVVYGGGYQIQAGSTTIQLRDFTLDLVGPSAIFSAIVIQDDTFLEREAIFSITASGPPVLPIVPNHGTISHDGLTLTFEQPFVDLINGVAPNSGLDTTTQIATLDLFSILAPLSVNSR